MEVWLERLDPRWGEDFGWHRVETPLIVQRVPAATQPAGPGPITLASVFGRGGVDSCSWSTSGCRRGRALPFTVLSAVVTQLAAA